MVVLCTEDYIRTLALLSLPPLLLHITASRKLFTNHRGGGRRAGRQAPLNAKTSRAHGACMATAVGSRHPPLAILYSYVLLCTLVHSSSTRYRSAFPFPFEYIIASTRQPGNVRFLSVLCTLSKIRPITATPSPFLDGPRPFVSTESVRCLRTTVVTSLHGVSSSSSS